MSVAAAPATPVGSPTAAPATAAGPASAPLLGIGAAAARARVSERALRYYEELGLLNPAGHTPGGMRRYSESDLQRVARIRELQTLLGFNLDEVAVVLRNEDRLNEIRVAYRDEHTGRAERRALLEECLVLQQELQATVAAKHAAIQDFMADLDARISKVRDLLTEEG